MDKINIGKDIILKEADSLRDLANSLDDNFEKACDAILQSKSHIIITGMGKSGHIANKIAATLASTGTPSFFIHPAEASHGDLGMITKNNVVLAISNSGESKELFDILEYCNRNGITLIGITAKCGSTLAKASDIKLLLPLEKEACYLNLAPTSSTTMTLALGDALAVAVYSKRNFSKTDFGNFHPGGKLGRQLVKVSDVYRSKSEIAVVNIFDNIKDAIMQISSHLGGCVMVVDNENKLRGIITDGDLRRHILEDIILTPVVDIMTKNPITVMPDILAADATHTMNEKRITSLPVVDNEHKLMGMIHIHDLVKLGF